MECLDELPCSRRTSAALSAGALALSALTYLLVASVDSVPPLNYGIRCNAYNKFVEVDHVYEAGRYFVGPWNDFMLFPASVRSIEFTKEERLKPLGVRYLPLHTRTKEGLALHMQVSVQYRLVKEKIGFLYQEFSHDYENFFVSVMRDTLIRVAAEYEASDLWRKRKEIGETMQRSLSETLKRTYAECWGFQLMSIELPTEYDQAIVATQVVQQSIATQEFAQVAAQIRAKTEVIKAEFSKKEKVIRAHGLANKTLRVKKAKASARSHILDVESGVMDRVKARLQFKPASLVEYQEFSAVAMLKNASLLFGFDDSSGVIVQPAAAGRSLASRAAEDAGGPDDARLRRLVGEEL